MLREICPLHHVFIKLSCFRARWFASSSSLLADAAKQDLAISFVTLAGTALANSFFDFVFLVIYTMMPFCARQDAPAWNIIWSTGEKGHLRLQFRIVHKMTDACLIAV